MDKFQDKYRIPSARAAWHGYDGGAYFVTICTAGKEHYLGEIADGAMRLSEIGSIAKDCFARVSAYYPYTEIPSFVVMPNHVHAIVIIGNHDGYDVNAGNCCCRDAINRVSTINRVPTPPTPPMSRNPMIYKSLGTVVRGVKARISRAAHLSGIPFAWQARFYDRIIRCQDEMNRIAEYIGNNVYNWDSDELNSDQTDGSLPEHQRH